MTLEFRDVALSLEEHEKQFKVDQGVSPCVTCNAAGVTTVGGAPVSALVDGEPNRVWVIAYGDSIPFIVLNNNVINPQTNVPVSVGYLEDSVEREILGVNRAQFDVGADVSAQYTLTAQVMAVSRSQFPILRTTAGGLLTINVSALEYDRLGGRILFQGQSGVSLAASVPSAGYKVKVLVYLSMITGLIATEAGVTVQDIPGQTATPPDTPPDGIASATVDLIGGQTVIVTADIVEAKRIVTPNTVPGLIYNGIPRSVDVPADYTYIRGGTRIEQGQFLRIHDTGRVILL